MTGLPMPMPVLRAVDANGVPLPGALMQFYVTGATTPTNVYTDKTLATPLANPVVADAGGLFVPMFLDPAITYRVQLLTAASALIRDIDPVAAPYSIPVNSVTSAMLQAGVAAANIGYVPLNRAGDTATNLLVNTASVTGQANGAGYIGAPANEQDAGYVFTALDQGRMVRANSAAAIAYTLPPNSSVAYPAGTTILVRNAGAGVVTLTRSAGVTLTIAGAGTSKDVALAQYGLATLVLELAPNTWVASGIGVS